MRTAAALLALVLAGPAAAQAQTTQAPATQTPATQTPAAPAMAIEAVKTGVYMVTGGGANVTVVVGPGAVVLVDSKNPGQAYYDDLNRLVRSVTAQPIREVIVTHHHPDHGGNVGRFEAAGVMVVGSAAMAEALKTYRRPDVGPLASPNTTFAESMTVEIGGVKAEARWRPGHTGDDSVVWFPAQRIVAAGDQVEDAPGIDYGFGGTLLGWVASMDGIAALNFDYVIPGHGEAPLTRAQFMTYRASVHAFADRARAAVKAGTPKDRLLASIKADDLGWPINTPSWTAPVRLDGLYAELSK